MRMPTTSNETNRITPTKIYSQLEVSKQEKKSILKPIRTISNHVTPTIISQAHRSLKTKRTTELVGMRTLLSELFSYKFENEDK